MYIVVEVHFLEKEKFYSYYGETVIFFFYKMTDGMQDVKG
jgi:hypothetical protein